MARQSFLVLALIGLLVAAPAVRVQAQEDDVDEANVVVLTEENFKSELAKAKYALVEFYAPWCGHCKKLKPAYAEAATALKDKEAPAILGKVDATEQGDLASKFGIQGYPTLKWFVDGELVGDYSGGRTQEEIVQWVTKKTGPATKDLAAVEDLEAVLKGEGVSLIAYFSELSGPGFDAYVAAAEKEDGAAFYTTTSEAAASKLGLTQPGGVALARSYPDFGSETVSGEGHAAFADAGVDADSLAAFLRAERLPAYMEFSQANAQTIFGSGVQRQIIVAAPAAALEPGAELDAALREASKSTRGKVVLVVAKLGTENAAAIVNFFGMDTEATEPQAVGFDSSTNKKAQYPADTAVDAAGIAAFADALAAGTAKPLLKSAPEPEDPTDNGVAVVVGTTVDKIVMDPEKDVLLEVYAPWCGHCKALAPTYEKLAKKFAGIDSVVIAKMDGTDNEHPAIDIKGFPTLLFFPAGEDKTPVVYSEGRDLKAFVKFLKSNAKKEFTLPKKAKKGKGKKEAKEADHEEL